MLDHAGATWDEPRGQGAIGDGPLHRAYAASDGWFWFGAHEGDRRALAAVLEVPDLATLPPPDLARVLGQRFATGTVAEWVGRLAGAGFGVSPYMHDLAALMRDPWVTGHGLSVTREHAPSGIVTHTGPAPRLSGTPLVLGRPTPAVGADTAEVLRAVGVDPEDDAVRRAVTLRAGVVDAG